MSDLRSALEVSGADGVMIGRGCYGRPWYPGSAAAALATGGEALAPSRTQQKDLILEHYDDMLEHYGLQHGVRHARKHLGWYAEHACGSREHGRHWRSKLCREEDPSVVRKHIAGLYDQAMQEAA
jgi:tRNA-dihydrouridine synthase B